MTETLDFSNVASAEGGTGKYLRPGVYYAKPKAVELVEKAGSTPYLKVTLEAVNDPYEGSIVEEKFFLSPKALSRLQYLHEKYLGFKLENKAITYQKLEEYFRQKFTTKPKTVAIAVGGEEREGKVYGRLPYTNFILEDENIEEGAFEKDSPEYNSAVRKGGAAPKPSAILSRESATEMEKLPWDN